MAIKTLQKLRHQRSLYRKSLMDTLRAWLNDYTAKLPRPCYLSFTIPVGKTNGSEVVWAFEGIFVVNDKLAYPLYIGGEDTDEFEVWAEKMEDQTLENLYGFIVQLATSRIKVHTVAEMIALYPASEQSEEISPYINQ